MAEQQAGSADEQYPVYQYRGAESQNAIAYAKIVAQAWANPTFLANLLKDPEPILRAAGVYIPQGQTPAIAVNTDSTYHFILPTPPRPPEQLVVQDPGDVQKEAEEMYPYFTS